MPRRETIFYRVLDAADKASALKAALAEPGSEGPRRYVRDPERFRVITESPFAYWISDRVRDLFRTLPVFASEGRTAKQGSATADDFRFVRMSWEAPTLGRGERWHDFTKGGSFSPFYADIHLVVNWARDALEIRNLVNPKTGRVASAVKNAAFWFRPGLTWPLRAWRFSPQAMPAACVTSVRGSAMFFPAAQASVYLGLGNSAAVDFVFKILLGRFAFPEFKIGSLVRVPVPDLTPADSAALAGLGRRAWAVKRGVDTAEETSHAFVLPSLLQVEGATLGARAAGGAARVAAAEAEVETIQADALYDLDHAERLQRAHAFSSGEPADADDDEEEPDDA